MSLLLAARGDGEESFWQKENGIVVIVWRIL